MATLEDMKHAAIYRDGKGGSESTIVATHLSQMALWMVRQGLDFYAVQDDSRKSRKNFIDSLFHYNRLALYLKGITSLFLCTGGILWYLRPTGETYEIHWFDKEQYRALYKPGGRELEEVIIRYSYKDYSQGMPSLGAGSVDRERWIRLRIRADVIIEEKSWQKPSLDPTHVFLEAGVGGLGFATETRQIQNTLGFIPCVESPNNPMRPGDGGTGEFDWMRTQIESEDSMREGMKGNVLMFNNPTLVTTRPKGQVLEAMDELNGSSQYGPRMSWSGNAGFRDSFSRQGSSAWRSDWNSRGGMRVARIIGGVQPDERFGYILPDPINGDQWRFVQEYRETIHEALGGIDPMGMRSGMTFGEVKSLYGKVAATAGDKCRSLWTYGLAKIFELAIYAEEQLFLDSFRSYLVGTGKVKLKKEETPASIPEWKVMEVFQLEGQPPGVLGLPPFGDREVKWRWTGPVFEDSPRDKLDLSIGVRNYQELGLGSLQSLQYLFPDKTEKEIKGMLTGVPFRYISSVSGSLGQLLSLQQQLGGMPDPLNPTMPLAARLDLVPLIQQVLSSLAQEISYGAEFDNADPTDEPRVNSTYPNDPSQPGFASMGNGSSGYSAASLLPSAGNSGDAAAGTSAANGPGGQLPYATSTSSGMAAGLPSQYAVPGYPAGGLRPNGGVSYSANGADWTSPLPVPGGTVSATAGRGLPNSGYPSVSAVSPGIPTDVQLSPNLLAQLFPAANAAAEQQLRNSGKNSQRRRKR